jgi:DNA-binding NarL/FixJ family response regulator
VPYAAGAGSDVDRRQPTPAEVLAFLAQGHDIGAAAKQLGVTVRAARLLLRQEMDRLGAKTITHAVALAISTGLLPHDIAAPGATHVR